jgi:hypothetical protein
MAQLAARHVFSRNALYALAAAVGIGMAAAVSMWMKLGTTVFFESIRTGLAYCFG